MNLRSCRFHIAVLNPLQQLIKPNPNAPRDNVSKRLVKV